MVTGREPGQQTGNGWRCEDCDWMWPLPDPPPESAECDNCGGELGLTL